MQAARVTAMQARVASALALALVVPAVGSLFVPFLSLHGVTVPEVIHWPASLPLFGAGIWIAAYALTLARHSRHGGYPAPFAVLLSALAILIGGGALAWRVFVVGGMNVVF